MKTKSPKKVANEEPSHTPVPIEQDSQELPSLEEEEDEDDEDNNLQMFEG